MKLSPEEESFLRRWMYDEVLFLDGPGPAKRLQVEHGVVPADLALLIAASMPDPSEQEAAGETLPEGSPSWPWAGDDLPRRVDQARAAMGLRPGPGAQSPSAS